MMLSRQNTKKNAKGKRVQMPTTTLYSALVAKMTETAKNHPESYVVVDGNTSEVLATGKDGKIVTANVQRRLKESQVPVVYKMTKKNEVLIL